MKNQVFCGIDRLSSVKSQLDGARIGLITNPTGLDKSFRSTIDILNQTGQLVCLFSPEHGVRGDQQAGAEVQSYIDPQTGLPVYSLYGESPHISKEILDKIDLLIFDIQDVGARFYTYLYTLSYAMQDASAALKQVLVLDRVNPLGGIKAEGTVLNPAFSSFVGRYPIATRYHLTIGEFARYINETQKIGCNLSIVKLSGWNRQFCFDDTDLLWVPPSPNLPTVDSCFCYIGSCLAEGTNLSEGRGTTKPFELVGAPWLNVRRVLDYMGERSHAGVMLRETWFTPQFSKYQGELCHGIEFHITDRTEFSPFETFLDLLDYIRKTHTEFSFLPPLKDGGRPFIDLLLGSDEFRREDFSPEDYIREQKKLLQCYQEETRPYYLY